MMETTNLLIAHMHIIKKIDQGQTDVVLYTISPRLMTAQREKFKKRLEREEGCHVTGKGNCHKSPRDTYALG